MILEALTVCSVIAITDGDTFKCDGDTFKCDGERVRIANIDAPEIFHARCDEE